MCDVRFYCFTFLRAKTADCRTHTVCRFTLQKHLSRKPYTPLSCFRRRLTRRTHVEGERERAHDAQRLIIF